MARKKKISIYVCGMVIDTSLFDDASIERCVIDRYNRWVGFGNVKFSISRSEEGKEFILRFVRDWGISYCTMFQDSLFAGDWQLWFGNSWQDNNSPTCKLQDGISERCMIFYDDFASVVKRYKDKCKELGATRPKEIELVKREKEEFVVKLKY